MDTLIDNRTFPVEMQEHTPPEHKKSTPWMLIVLIFIALGVLVFLAYRIFYKREVLKKTATDQKTSLKERRIVVENFESFNPQLTENARKQKVQVFFSNNNS